jgi:hypothetical protein
MFILLNIICVIATFIVAEGLLYITMNSIFGNIKYLNKTVIFSLQIKHIIFYTIGLLLLLMFTTFYKPW